MSSEDDLRRSSQREHTATYVVKAHGDYLQQTIRNTTAELAELDSAMEMEVQEIFDRYGLVVLGYSGSDGALMRLLRNRNSRHGIYWVSRSAPTDEVASVLEALGGRVILRDTAADFLTDLQRRIEAFRSHPSGETPQIVASEIITLLRARDEIGLREKLKEEWRALERRVGDVVEPRLQLGGISDEDAVLIEAELMPAMERMLGALLPLVEHRSPLFAEQSAPVARILERANRQAPTTWPELGQWVVWWMTQAIGAYAVATGHYGVVGELLQARPEHAWGGSIASMHPPRIAVAVLERALPPPTGQTWNAPEWEHLIQRVPASDFLVGRYPELTEEPGVKRWLNDFSFLVSYGAARADESRIVGYWGMYHDGGLALANRLRQDSVFRDELARAAFGISGDEFAKDARGRLARAVNSQTRTIYVPGGWGLMSDAIDGLPKPPASEASDG